MLVVLVYRSTSYWRNSPLKQQQNNTVWKRWWVSQGMLAGRNNRPYLQICSLGAAYVPFLHTSDPSLRWCYAVINVRHTVTHGRFTLQPNAMKQLQLFLINMNTNTRLRSTSLTSGPVYAGCRGVTGSAGGRMLASASNGSTSGACACSTTQHTKASNTSFKANSDFSSKSLPLWFL